jgi:hypothetical protein
MAARPLHAVGRLAVERARARLPGFAPDSVEVVELIRGQAFVVVRTAPAGVAVLDEYGRLVRGRPRLEAIARHVDALGRTRLAFEEARLERRRVYAEESIALLARQCRVFSRQALRPRIAALVDRLEALRDRLGTVQSELERQRGLPPTERTLRRRIGLLNNAAAADRAVVLAARVLAADLMRVERGAKAHAPTTLQRWLAARLGSSDLPFFYAELDELEGRRFVESFVASARV